MFKNRKVGVIIVTIFIYVFMSACSNEDANMIESLEKEVVELETTIDEANELNGKILEENNVLLDEINEKDILLDKLANQIEELDQEEISEADRILDWFNGRSEPMVENREEVWSEDEVLYYLPVAEEGLQDMESLRSFLLLYFDEKNVEELLTLKIGDYLPFIEIDGVLYRGMGLIGN